MHDIEPHYKWRDRYQAENDDKSPFYGMKYSEFSFTNKVYNYFIHPQWDEIGSPTLYVKLIYVDYADGFAVVELIGEWDDCLRSDIMHLKRNVVDVLMEHGVKKYALICENVLNYHFGEDDYYAEWSEEVRSMNGYIVILNPQSHVAQEMVNGHLPEHVYMGEDFDLFNWRKYEPNGLSKALEEIIDDSVKTLR